MVFVKPPHTALAQLVSSVGLLSRMSWVRAPQAVNSFFTSLPQNPKKLTRLAAPFVAVSEMDSIFARVKRLPRKAAIEAKKHMKEQAADAYDFDSDSDRSQADSWTRSVNNTTVTLIPTPGFRSIATRSSTRLPLSHS